MVKMMGTVLTVGQFSYQLMIYFSFLVKLRSVKLLMQDEFLTLESPTAEKIKLLKNNERDW